MYRQLLIALLSLTSAGCGEQLPMNDVISPSKRLRNWHRKSGHEMPLRQYARIMAKNPVGLPGERAVARAWLDNKGIRP